MQKSEIKRTDKLAYERTKLANERTFLAYFRTFVVFMSSSFVILKMEVLSELYTLAYIIAIVAIFILIIGTIRFFYVNRRIKKIFQ